MDSTTSVRGLLTFRVLLSPVHLLPRLIFVEPLSELLSLVKLRTSVSAGLNAAGAWSLAFPALKGIKFNAVVQGSCWLMLKNGKKPIRLEQGDCFLLMPGQTFTLVSDQTLPTQNAEEIYKLGCDQVGVCNGGGEFLLVGAHFTFSGLPAANLLSGLPSVIAVTAKHDQATILRWSIDTFYRELSSRGIGQLLVTENLARIMLVQVLRIYLDSANLSEAGWLHVQSDRQLGRAVKAIHADVSRPWNLTELSRIAGLSRSTFARQFKSKASMTPMEYLARWRIYIAAERISENPSLSIRQAASDVGYELEAAFSRSFKRQLGSSPKQYRSSASLRMVDSDSWKVRRESLINPRRQIRLRKRARRKLARHASTNDRCDA